MIVSELIAKLQDMPADSWVRFEVGDDTRYYRDVEDAVLENDAKGGLEAMLS